MITNDVNDYINLLVRIAHITCNHPIYVIPFCHDGNSSSVEILKLPYHSITTHHTQQCFFFRLHDGV